MGHASTTKTSRRQSIRRTSAQVPIVDRNHRIVGWTSEPSPTTTSCTYIEINDMELAERAGAPPGWNAPWRCVAIMSGKAAASSTNRIEKTAATGTHTIARSAKFAVQAARPPRSWHPAVRPASDAIRGSASTVAYRLYFLDEYRRILATEVLDAPSDDHASEIAAQLAHACSDECTGFELWVRNRRVAKRVELSEPPSPMRRAVEEAVIEREERILESRSRIAHSRKLLARLGDLRRNQTPVNGSSVT